MDCQSIFQSVFEASLEPIIVLDDSGQIINANSSLCNLIELSIEEVLLINVDEIIHKSIEFKEGIYSAEFNNHSDLKKCDFWAIKKDRSLIPIQIRLSHIMETNKNCVVIFIDKVVDEIEYYNNLKGLNEKLEISIKKKQKELNRIEKSLNSANEIIYSSQYEAIDSVNFESKVYDLQSKFISLASHEFRTPLSTILTSASLIEKYPETHQQLKREKHTQRIKNNVNNLTNILSEFLTFEKLQNGKITVSKEDVKIQDLIQSCIEDFDNDHLKLEKFDVEFYGGSDFYTDETLLSNVLKSLILYVTKYSSSSEFKIEIYITKKSLELSLKNDGIVIPEEELKKIDSQFFKSNTISSISGTSLGLSICRQFIELLGGKLLIRKQGEKGSVFKIKLFV